MRLLPPNLLFQDSCRLLLPHALIENALDLFQSWNEIMACQPNGTGSYMRIKEAMLERPYFSKKVLTDLPADSEIPWTCNDLEALMAPISRLAGLAQKMTLHSLRRGGA